MPAPYIGANQADRSLGAPARRQTICGHRAQDLGCQGGAVSRGRHFDRQTARRCWTEKGFGEVAMTRSTSAGTVLATALSLIAFAASGSAQQSLPDGVAPPAAAEPHGITAKPSPGSGRQQFRPAFVMTGVELRSGPGARYGLVQVVPEGTTVDVAKCSGGWCDVVWRSRRGYASASALSIGEAGAAGAYVLPGYEGAVPAYYGAQPTVFLGFSVGWGYGPHSHWHRHW
jgi:SH3 domain-containing protein